MISSDEFIVNVDNIIASDYPSVVRMAARQLKHEGYLSVGSFLKSLSTEDLTMLVYFCEAVTSDEADSDDATSTHRKVLVLTVLTFLLALGEGTVELTAENINKFVNTTTTFIILESLWRKGLIELEHDKLSYSDQNAIIAREKKQ